MSNNSEETTDSSFSLRGKVYFIFQKGDDTRCKIGKSIHPNKRKTQLQTGNPDELYIYKTIIGYTSIEGKLHSKFKEKQIRNTEWFYLSKEDVNVIVDKHNEEELPKINTNQENIEDKHIEKDLPKINTNQEDVEDKHNEEELPKMSYICKKCQKSFTSQRYLKQHQNKKIPCDKIHRCNKCDNVFNTAYILRKHMERKTPCAPDLVPVIKGNNKENKCHMCGKTYSSKSNLKKHQKKCSVKDNPDLLQRLLEEQIRSNELMSKMLENRIGLPSVTNNNNNNIIVNNTQNNIYMNVTINCFGTEDLSRLDTEKVLKLVKNHAGDFIPRMIEYVHANPDIPEYHNVFFDKEKGKAIVYGPVSDNERSWQSKNIKEISDQLTDKIQHHMHPTVGPYFNHVMQYKDSETANKIISLANGNLKTEELLEKNKDVLTIVTKNDHFIELVGEGVC